MNRARSFVAPAVVAAICSVALGGCGGGPTPAATVTQVAPTVTVAPPTTATPTVEPAATETPTAAPETFTTPNVVGQNLQLAQDTLQKEGSFILDQEDALGLDRIQVNDSNWQVCAQSPKAGMEVPVGTVITLSSVKLAEDCP